MEELIPINVVIGDRTYRIRIAPTDEEVVRKTIKLINDKIIEFKTQFAGKDMQDYVAMVVLWYATQQKAAGDQPLLASEADKQLQSMEKLLDRMLQG
ncbi:cell division protein ZapA [Paraflavitalea sp. CAU 1676]|uniref:cell division protein ZapA n=1 Tax=Paraflavitalea sp. CAU 1676 TaxID=3032598 RepID=UPI0023D97C43|nr:cell division protein ZapA [Paraflavitalea sp. CAU 1676]MDF2187427.1 cell division protein ZapA [Paraflavitalea sp. CAU 1676]